MMPPLQKTNSSPKGKQVLYNPRIQLQKYILLNILYTKERKTHVSAETCIAMFTAALFILAKKV